MVTAIVCCCTAAVVGCHHSAIVAPSVSFNKDIIPIFTASCAINSSCHSGNSNTGDNINLDSAAAYQSILHKQLLNVNNPTASLLYVEVESGIMPKSPYQHLSDGQVTIILNWIQQGANNN